MTTKTPPASSKASAAPSRIDRLFAVLASYYGRHWLALWDDCPLDLVKRQWADDLARFDDAVFRAALEAIKSEGRKFPPSLPEFAALCGTFQRKGAHKLALVTPRVRPPAGTFQKLRDVLSKVKVDEGAR